MAFVPIEEDGGEGMRSFMGPGQVDQTIRQAIQMAWMMLPAEKKSIAEVERVVRQLVDRALEDLREDGITFGQGV